VSLFEDLQDPEDRIQKKDNYFYFPENNFEDQFGNDVQTSYRQEVSIDDDSEFSHLLDS